jgi:hypothetical protein
MAVSPGRLGFGFGTWLTQVRFSTCEARVARRRENTGERDHTGQVFFAGGMSASAASKQGGLGIDNAQKAGLLSPA